jgi:hypothetical protein
MESEQLGIELGALVDTQAYDAVSKAFWIAFPSIGDIPSEFAITAGVAWNNVGYRTRAAAENLEAFTQQFEANPKAPHEQIYAQINHFFGFLTNVTAAAESMVYAIYVAHLGLKKESLTTDNLKVQRKRQLNELMANAGLAEVGKLLKTRLDAKLLWWEMRDVLMHRGQPRRNLYVGGSKDAKTMLANNPKAAPAGWIDEFEFHANCGDGLADWLRKLIGDVSALLVKTLTVSPQERPDCDL